jgi:hypothetical protein
LSSGANSVGGGRQRGVGKRAVMFGSAMATASTWKSRCIYKKLREHRKPIFS